jgi:glutathione S-transferase
MKLYSAPNTRAARPHWMLEELEVPYVIERLDFSKGEHKSLDYTKIHPLGAVPALTDGSLAMFESAAIVMYLADKYPEKGLAPAPGTAPRGQYYPWILFVMTTLEPAVVQIALHTRFLPEDKRSPQALEEGRARATTALKVLDEALKGKEYIVGGRFSAADIMIGSILDWGGHMGILDGFPELRAYATRLTDRPAWKRMKSNG